MERRDNVPRPCVCKNIIMEGIWTRGEITEQRTRHTCIWGLALSDDMMACFTWSLGLVQGFLTPSKSVKSNNEMCHRRV